MGDERDQDVQRAPLWPPDAEPGSAEPRPTAPADETHPPLTPDPWRDWGAAPSEPPSPQEPAQPPYQPQPAPPPYEPSYEPQAPQPPQSPQNPWQAAATPWEPPAAPSVSDAPTMRVSAAPASPISDAPTMRVSAAPASASPAPDAPPASAAPAFAPAQRLQATDAPAQRFSAGPSAAASPAATPGTSATGGPLTTPPTPPAEPPGAAQAPRKGPSRAWRLGLTLIIIVILLAGAGGLYAYASSLAAAPQKVMASYCAALKRDDYRAAYGLLSSSAQGQEAETNYLADASDRDIIEGSVTQCSATPTQDLSPLSFLRDPRSLIFNAQITRKKAASGQIALTRDATGWHVAALSSALQGVDLGPLATEQAVCKAFAARAYDQAYALLSSPYQKEQGDAATFARAFGSTLTVTGCAPDLKTYSVNSADQQATVTTTLTVSVAAATSGAPSAFTLPAKLTFVREATGWRVDAITPLLNQ